MTTKSLVVLGPLCACQHARFPVTCTEGLVDRGAIELKRTRGFGNVEVSIECFGVLIRNPRAHVPPFTDSYLPVVNSLTKSGTGLL